MLKILLKKQFLEVFRSYFYDAKKNRMRSKGAIAGFFIFFFVIMVGFLGGMFAFLSLGLCGPLTEAGMGWLYFLVMSGIAVFLGAFGSVFNTYAGLYLAKDSDLLLAMPIPVRTIMAARLLNVYLLGALYSSVAMIPALVISWVITGPTVSRVMCGILLLLIVTVLVLLLSCGLGWIVAKISVKLKNKSFITVLISLACIGIYYFVYFNAHKYIQQLVQNALVYGEKIRGTASVLYFFGRIGEGSWPAAAVFAAVTFLLFLAVWHILSRSFLRLATAGNQGGRIRYRERKIKTRSSFGAFLAKEFSRFTSNPNYMLNCGLGVLMLPAAGVLLLLKGTELCQAVDGFLTGRPDSAAVLICTALCLLCSMNNSAVPSVSLEGRSLWIPLSLPLRPGTVLRAKAAVQMILTAAPLLIAGICAAVVIPASAEIRVMLCLMPLSFAVFLAMYGMVLGVCMPILVWTNETVPIKQNGAVLLFIFSSWGFSMLPGGLYLLAGYRIGAALYLFLWTIVLAGLSVLLLRWLDTRGAERLTRL